MARSLNKVLLIGNLTRDPELRYTPQGTAVCSFSIATNRQWVTDSGEKKEDVEFHRLVAWNKLAEICAQLLKKGRKIYVEGRLQTRNWTAQDGTTRSTTEVTVTDMILLDQRREGESIEDFNVPSQPEEAVIPEDEMKEDIVELGTTNVGGADDDGAVQSEPSKGEEKSDDLSGDDIPF